jgi:hypothetical protein
VASARTTAWILVAAATLAMLLRAPVYLGAPSFWAEEGTLYFVVAWERSLFEALTFRPATYLILWANLATTAAAHLVRAGLVPLAHAPLVTVLFALVAQLVPVSVIAWSRARFWDGPLRRTIGVAIVLFGALTDEIWLNTINCQPWLTVAAALLLLEPATIGRMRAWVSAALLTVAGLSAPAACMLVPLFAWRAWRVRSGPAIAQAVVLALAALGQATCVWIAGGEPLAQRTAGLDLGTFATALWVRTLIIPTLGVGAGESALVALRRVEGLGPAGGVLLLALAAMLLLWLAGGLRDGGRHLIGAYVLVTTFTIFTSTGGKALLLSSPWASSRYFYAPGVLLLLALLGRVRSNAPRVQAGACALLLGVGIAHGVAQYRTVRWRPNWTPWADEVHAWEHDPKYQLRIWPPPWKLGLSPSSR